MSTTRVRRFDDARCMGSYSVKSAVCRLCVKQDECDNVTRGVSIRMTEDAPMNRPERRLCRKCLYVERDSMGGGRYDKCRCPRIWSGTVGRRYCQHERSESFDGRYVMCGEEGKLWEPKPPTKWETMKAHISHHILGPEEHRAKKREGGGLVKFLREAIRGPDKPDGGEQKEISRN